MVVCKYFLQGNCRFGSSCHYDHQITSTSNYNQNNHQSILRQANFGNVQNSKPSLANPDIGVLMKTVSNDMNNAEKGGQWLLSCYGPFTGKPLYPGLEDYSPEEIRFGFYGAQTAGTLDQYMQQLQIIVQNTMGLIRAIQNPTPEVIQTIQNIYNGSRGASNILFNQNSTPNNFTQQSNNIFANKNNSLLEQGNMFKSSYPQTTNIFATASANVFANASTPPNQNIFATNNSSGQNFSFGYQQPNIFAGQSQTPLNTSDVFQPAFGNIQPTNIFASPPQSIQQQNIFQSQAQPSIFNHQPNTIVAQTQQPTQATQNMYTFQVSQQQQNMLGAEPNNLNSQQQSSNPINYSASIFGYSSNSNPSANFGSVVQTTIDESLYSKLEDLSEEEKQWYESDTGDMYTIPEKPPTYDMCFKT